MQGFFSPAITLFCCYLHSLEFLLPLVHYGISPLEYLLEADIRSRDKIRQARRYDYAAYPAVILGLLVEFIHQHGPVKEIIILKDNNKFITARTVYG